MNKNEHPHMFDEYIKESIIKLHKDDYSESFETIMKAFYTNPNAPEPHNLLGIMYECQGNCDLARKHYRAAYALDPTYKPASENLERLCSYLVGHKISINFGEK